MAESLAGGWVGRILAFAYRSGTEYDLCLWLSAWLGWVGGIITSAYRSGTEYDQWPWLRAWLGWVGGILTFAYRSGTEYDQWPWLRAWLVDGWVGFSPLLIEAGLNMICAYG